MSSNGTASNGYNSNGSSHDASNSPDESSNSPSSSQSKSSSSTSSISLPEDYVKVFERLHLEAGKAELPPRLPDVVSGGSGMVVTNAHLLSTTSKEVYQYDLDYTRQWNDPHYGERSKTLNATAKEHRKDFFLIRDRTFHQQMFHLFVKKYPEVFDVNPDMFCYDYNRSLFSLVKLTPPNDILKLSAADIATFWKSKMEFDVVLKITVPQPNVFNIKDFEHLATRFLTTKDLTMVRFLEMATSHYATENPDEYTCYSAGDVYFKNPHLFGLDSRACPLIGRGDKHLNIGARKKVIHVEEAEGGPVAIVESKKTPFKCVLMMHLLAARITKCTLHDVINLQQLHFLREQLVGFVVHAVHLPSLIFSIAGITDYDAYSQKFSDSEGKEISVFDYFIQKYGKTLKYPHWPLAIRKKRGSDQESYFPFELLCMGDHQRASVLLPEEVKDIVKACAVHPHQKKEDCQKCLSSFKINQDKLCQNAEITVNETPLEVPARVLDAPQIIYGQNKGLNPKEDGTWTLPRLGKYIKPGQIRSWCALLLDIPDQSFDLNELQLFVDKYVQTAKNHGLMLPKINGLFHCEANEDALNQFMKDNASDCQFVLIAHPDRETKLHYLIKALEREWSCITQCVQTSTMTKVKDNYQGVTMDNILFKTNVKLGGLNCNFSLSSYPISGSVLFIGMGINLSGGGFSKSGIKKQKYNILGFAANDGVDPSEFIGNFFLQPTGVRAANVLLEEIFDEIFGRFKANRQISPSEVIIYRNGCDEGQYAQVLAYEVVLLESLIKTHAPGAALTLFVPSKMHNTRFFLPSIDPNQKSSSQNIPVGTVINSGITHPAHNEFFLNSHLALQGTAKTPKYTVLYTSNPSNSLEKLINWTHILCYGYQIVNSPVSVPAPVYIANCYAERGRGMFNSIQSSNLGSDVFNEECPVADDDESFLYKKSILYNYSKKEFLRNKRINA